MKRSVIASAAGVVLVGVIACTAARSIVVGPAASGRSEFDRRASPAARDLVRWALEGIEPALLLDVHAHVAGSEADASGCELHPSMHSWLHLWRRFQLWVYLAAAGVEHEDHGAEEFAARLLDVSRGRVAILALDHRYAEDGTLDRPGTALYVPNDWVFRLAAEHPRVFVPVVSVHPYRKDALLELERCAASGAKLVKWVPNSMGIDPADPRCDPFYDRMQRLGMALLSHAGEENALVAVESDLGNPLRLRRALDHGVRVIVAHCGTLGESEDLDDPAHRKAASFDLFLRLMDDARYRGLAYGDLSAVCFRNRDPRVLRTLLERTDLHERLVDGTDWPLPAIRILTSTRRLERAGLVSKSERAALEEVSDCDPRLFDLVLKRTLRGPHGERFPASVFQARPELFP